VCLCASIDVRRAMGSSKKRAAGPPNAELNMVPDYISKVHSDTRTYSNYKAVNVIAKARDSNY
jgi:hypothetical protein